MLMNLTEVMNDIELCVGPQTSGIVICDGLDGGGGDRGGGERK